MDRPGLCTLVGLGFGALGRCGADDPVGHRGLQHLIDHRPHLVGGLGTLEQRGQLPTEDRHHRRHGLHPERLGDLALGVDIDPPEQEPATGGVRQVGQGTAQLRRALRPR